jgi:hypothetical protein
MHQRSWPAVGLGWMLILTGTFAAGSMPWGCAGESSHVAGTVSEEGLNSVRVEANPDKQSNTQPVKLTPQEIEDVIAFMRLL